MRHRANEIGFSDWTRKQGRASNLFNFGSILGDQQWQLRLLRCCFMCTVHFVSANTNCRKQDHKAQTTPGPKRCFKFQSLVAKTRLRSVAFQPCISWRGLNMVKIGKKHDFVQILGLKTPISVDRNFEHLTSEGSVAQNFEILSSLTPSLQNMDIDGPN